MSNLEHPRSVTSFAISPDSKVIASTCGNGCVYLWKHAKPFARIDCHFVVTSVAFSPNGWEIVTAGADDSVRTWSVSTGKQLNRFDSRLSRVICIAWSPKGDVIASGGSCAHLYLWRLRKRIPGLSLCQPSVKRLYHLNDLHEEIVSVCFTPDGSKLLSGGKTHEGGFIFIWNVKQCEQIMKVSNQHQVLSVSCSRDSRFAVCCSAFSSLFLLDLSTGEIAKRLQSYGTAMQATALSYDSSMIASSSATEPLRLWDLASMRTILQVSGKTDSRAYVVFSHDSKYVAYTEDKFIRLFHLDCLHISSFYGLTKNVDKMLRHGSPVNNASASEKTTTALMNACYGGHLSIVEKLLERSADITSQDENRNTALHAACQIGRLDITKRLIEHQRLDDNFINAANAEKQTALHVACLNGHLDVIRYLLDCGASINQQAEGGETALRYACKKRYVAIIELLLKRGADVTVRDTSHHTVLHYAYSSNDIEITRCLLSTDQTEKHTLLHHGEGCDDAMIQLLVATGVDINTREDDNTPLDIALRRKQWRFAESLIKYGANVNASGRGGNTVLHKVADQENMEALQILIKYGVDLNSHNHDQNTALHNACRKHQLNVASCLIENLASLNLQGKGGYTEIHFASEIGDLNLVKLLAISGANMAALTHDHQSALQIACTYGHHQVAEFLLEHGVEFNHKNYTLFDDQEDLCPVCQELFENDRPRMLLPCLHSACSACVDDMLTNEPICVICREPCSALDIVPYAAKDSTCPLHANQELVKFCKACQVLVCVKCLDIHCDHTILSLLDATKDCKLSLQVQTTKLAHRLVHLEVKQQDVRFVLVRLPLRLKSVKNLIQQSFEHVVAQISTKYSLESWKTALNLTDDATRRRDSLMTSVEEEIKADIKTAVDQLYEFELVEEQILATIQYAKFLTSNMTINQDTSKSILLNILLRYTAISQRLARLSKAETANDPAIQNLVTYDSSRNDAIKVMPDEVDRLGVITKLDYTSMKQSNLKLGRCGDKPGSFYCLSDMTELPNGQLMVVDRGNNRLQILSRLGLYIREIHLWHLRYVAVRPSGEFWIASEGYLVYYSASGDVINGITIRHSIAGVGVCADGTAILGGRDTLQAYAPSGLHLWSCPVSDCGFSSGVVKLFDDQEVVFLTHHNKVTIRSAQDGHLIRSIQLSFIPTVGVAVIPESKLIVCCKSNRIFICTFDGQEVNSWIAANIHNVCAITVLSDGHIAVADNYSIAIF